MSLDKNQFEKLIRQNFKEEFPLEKGPSLMKDFVSIFKETTESPDEFLATIPMFLASVISGKWVTFNNQILNNYYLIVGPTGVSKKTTAQSLASRLLKDLYKRFPNLIYKYPQENEANSRIEKSPIYAYPLVTHFSIEGLQSRAIGNGTSAAILMGEYGSLFEVGKRQSQQNTISELTNMYDANPISVKTVSRTCNADNYAISILACSTESWLGDFTSKKNVSGGFVNRHLVIMGKPERILATPRKISESDYLNIIEALSLLLPKGIRAENTDNDVKWLGETKFLEWSIGAKTIWNSYYFERTKQMRLLTSPLLSELSARELTHATKLAGLSAFMEARNVVEAGDLEFGIKMARWSTQNLISMACVESLYLHSNEAQTVLSRLKRSGPMYKTDLARSIGGQQGGINKAISHLIVDGALEDCPDGLLRVQKDCSNSQLNETEKYFGKSNICDFIHKNELGVET